MCRACFQIDSILIKINMIVQIDCPQNKIKAIKLNKSLSVIIINLIMVKNQLYLYYIQVDSSAQLDVIISTKIDSSFATFSSQNHHMHSNAVRACLLLW